MARFKQYFWTAIVWTALSLIALAVIVVRSRDGVETDLYVLADSDNTGVIGEIAKGLSGEGRILFEGTDFSEITSAVLRIRRELDQKPKHDFSESLKFIDAHKTGLLSPATRELLMREKYDEVSNGAMARLFSPVPRLLSVKDDPFLLATEYVTSLQSSLSGDWTLKDGFLFCERGGCLYVLETLDLSHVSAQKIAGFVNRQYERCKRGGSRSEAGAVRIYLSGAPFHSSAASVRSKKEIGVLSIVSLVCVLLLGWKLFRSFNFLPMLVAAQCAGFLMATASLFAAFTRPHVLTFVFGTSLIGLSVDYAYHAKMSGDVRKILRPLTLSLLTTVACFSPLLFADVVVLRQMALFSISGLISSYALVVTFGRLFCGADNRFESQKRSPAPFVPGKLLVLLVIVLSLVAAVGICRVKVESSPSVFYRPNEYLAESEKKIFELSPAHSKRFAFVPGDTLQEALEREESLEIKGLSAVIPSLKRQRENASLKAALYRSQGEAYFRKTGLRVAGKAGTVPDYSDDKFLDAGKITEEPFASMVRSMWIGKGLVSPLPDGVQAPQGVEVLEPRSALEDLFHRFTKSTVRLLAISLASFVLILLVIFRGRMLRYVLPVVCSLVVSCGVLGWLGMPMTFFTMLCFFVLCGLGIDYVIFEAGSRTDDIRRTVTYSFLTSFVSLGILSFTCFPVTQSMGVTFAFGLLFARIFASLFANFSK